MTIKRENDDLNIKNDWYYNFTYNENKRHYSPEKSKTTIGTKWERKTYPDSGKWRYFNYLSTRNETVQDQNFANAFLEINRICEHLQLPALFRKYVYKQYKIIFNLIPRGTKYRSYKKLVPIVIYIFAKIENIVIEKKKLLEYSYITKRDLNYFILHAKILVPQYDYRDKRKYMLQKIMKIKQECNLNMDFYYLSLRFLDYFVHHVPGKKEEIYIGLASSLSFLFFYYPLNKKSKHTIHSVCKKAGIVMSTVDKIIKDIFQGNLNYRTFIHSRKIVLDFFKKENVISERFSQ